MGDRLVVSLDLLADTAESLRALRSELDSAPEVVRDVHDALGHGGLADAVGDFGNNWRYHRRKLCESVEAVEQMASDSARTYADVDRQLADSLTTKSST